VTQLDIGTGKNSQWSKEAIVALISVFIMVLLSGIGLACKHCLPNPNRWTISRWRSILMTGKWRESYVLDAMTNVEQMKSLQ
jgi:hypothetical protein